MASKVRVRLLFRFSSDLVHSLICDRSRLVSCLLLGSLGRWCVCVCRSSMERPSVARRRIPDASPAPSLTHHRLSVLLYFDVHLLGDICRQIYGEE